MKYSLIILVFFFTTILFPQSEKGTESKNYTEKFDPNRDPSKDLKTTLSIAQKTNKRIILDVGGEWCIWCHRLDKFFEDNSDINKFLRENFIVLKVNYSPENKNEKFLSQFPKVAGYPHLFVLNKNGKLLHSQNSGDLEKGKGHDREKVMEFLQKWADN